jgi:hypothetical protein
VSFLRYGLLGELESASAAPRAVPSRHRMQKPCDLDFCTNAGGLVCTACKSARYCCREHQRQAWPMHRSTCKLAAAHGELKTRLASGELIEAEAGCQQLSVFSADATKVHELTAAGLLETLVGALLRHGVLGGHLDPTQP